MKQIEYSSVICEYCDYTDMGTQATGTSPTNLCEGAGCVKAYERYVEETGDETKLEDLF